ncbi:MAG: ABC transporter substrate-binding protein [Alphaproteobacteria bacterium]|nr:MAG: ABC transporter substrate-binding protein [Alphaproteobacteria bacterium]
MPAARDMSIRIIAAAAGVIGFAAPAANAADVVKIGTPLALTGSLADEGKKQDVVWNMWLAKVNAAGGMNVGGKKMKVELVKYDYQSDGQRAAQLAEKLITDDKVDFVLSPFGSGHTKIVATVAERYQTPLLACASSSESVFDQSFKHLFGTLSPNGGMTTAMVAFFKGKMPNLKRIAVLGRDDVFPKSMAQGTSAAAKAAGLDVVYDQLYAVGTMDHSAAVSAIKAANPDWIYVTGYTQDLILVRKQMADLGAKAPIITMVAGPAYKEYTDGLGSLANGVTSSSWWHHATSYKGIGPWPTTADFYKDFVAREKSDPDYVHASCAAAVVVLQDAIERAGSTDKSKVRDALAATNVSTFYGPVKFAANGMNEVRDLPIIQVQDKQIKVLHPADIKDGEMVLLK